LHGRHPVLAQPLLSRADEPGCSADCDQVWARFSILLATSVLLALRALSAVMKFVDAERLM